MSQTLRHAFVIARRELGELWLERALMVASVLFTFGLPTYLGWLAAKRAAG